MLTKRPNKKRLITAAVTALCLSATAHAADTAAYLNQAYPSLEALFRDIHSHPELGFHETRTAALLAKELRAAGFQVTEKVGGTGIVGVYRNGPGPTVLVRTELDALPMEEKTGLPYASHVVADVDGQPTPVAHACGHDIHMAIWLGVARTLVAQKAEWRGTLLFIGQPAEEKGAGARAMLKDGLFERFGKPDYALALHVGSGVAGALSFKPGTTTSAVDEVQITFNGRGAHGSTPNRSIDPIVIGSHFVSDVQTVISREKDPAAFGVVTVGAFQAGSVSNIIPDKAVLKLTLRSQDPAVRDLLLKGVERTARGDAAIAGAPDPGITHLMGTGAGFNDPAVTQRVGDAEKAAFGATVTLLPITAPPHPPSDDFSEFAAAGVPSLMFGLGGADPAKVAESQATGVPLPANHSPYFQVLPEPSIKAGADALVLAVKTLAPASP
ncbi:MAG: amidohydrolase [Azospirillaceae bacterium]|nr:amidohydrolase [Azospirillaceae bacterium]